MPGFIGQKVGMTRLPAENGKLEPVTVISIPDNVVLQVKTQEKDGYSAYVVGVDPREKFKAPGSKYKDIKEFRFDDGQFEKDTVLPVDLLEGLETISICGISKGKGFAGGMKRHNFKGLRATHGSMYVRALGSTGTRKKRRTHKGKKMAGHMGVDQVTVHGKRVITVDKDNKLIALSGSVPGGNKSFVYIFWNKQ